MSRKARAYGVQLRLHGYGNWAWLKPNADITSKPMEAASWDGPDGEQSAIEAAKTVSIRNPGLTFRVKRL